MAASGDFVYLQRLLDRGIVAGRVLELGSYNRQSSEWGNSRRLVERHSLSWQGTDIDAGPDVDFTLDVLDADAVAGVEDRWDTVLVPNLLEHVFDPICALENAMRLLAPAGRCVVVGPAVWQLHDFPADYWRPLPDFYVEFARRQRCELVAEATCWIVGEKIIAVDALKRGPQKVLPSLHDADRVYGRARALRSRVAHKVLNTVGRELFFPYVGLGACLRAPAQA